MDAPSAVHSVAYFDNAYGGRLDSDMHEIADAGASRVIYCAPEHLQLYNPEGIALGIKAARRAGLECFIDPWGAYGIFGGEAPSDFLARGGTACLRQPAFIQEVKRFVGFAASTGADGIFWDEPHLKCNCCATMEFLDMFTGFSAQEMRNNVNAPPFHRPILEGAARLSTVDIIGSNGYYDIAYGHINRGYREPHIQVKETADWLAGLGKDHGKQTEIFLQGFKSILMAGHEEDLVADWIQPCADAARAGGVINLALWGYRGCESLSCLWPNGRQDQCAAVWRAATEVFQQS